MNNEQMVELLFSLDCYESPNWTGFPEMGAGTKSYYNPYIDATYFPELNTTLAWIIQIGFEKPHRLLANLAITRSIRLIMSRLYERLDCLISGAHNIELDSLLEDIIQYSTLITTLHDSTRYVHELYSLWGLVAVLKNHFESKLVPSVESLEKRSLSALEKKYPGFTALYKEFVNLGRKGGVKIILNLVNHALDIHFSDELYKADTWLPDHRLRKSLFLLQKASLPILLRMHDPDYFCRWLSPHVPDLRPPSSICDHCNNEPMIPCKYRSRSAYTSYQVYPRYGLFEGAVRLLAKHLCYQWRLPYPDYRSMYILVQNRGVFVKNPPGLTPSYLPIDLLPDFYPPNLIFWESIRHQLFKAKGLACPFEKEHCYGNDCPARNILRFVWLRYDVITKLWRRLKVPKRRWDWKKPRCLEIAC